MSFYSGLAFVATMAGAMTIPIDAKAIKKPRTLLLPLPRFEILPSRPVDFLSLALIGWARRCDDSGELFLNVSTA
jgi:hypothetical protein